MAAIQLNEERKRKLSSWLDEVGRMVRVRFMNSWEMSIQRCLRFASIDVILGFFDEFPQQYCPDPPFPNSTFVACWILSISFNFFPNCFSPFFSFFSEIPQVNSWRSPADVFDAILQQRPDIHRLLSGDEAAEEDALDAEITRFGVKIEEASRTRGISHRYIYIYNIICYYMK